MKRRLAASDGQSRSCSSTPLSLVCPPSNKLSRSSYSDGNVEKNKGNFQQICCKIRNEEANETEKVMGCGDCKGEECSSGREMLQRYRMQVAGNVGIPEFWDQEERLKEWVDPKVMDESLAPEGLFSARTALITDCNVQRNRNGEASTLDLKAPTVSCSQ